MEGRLSAFINPKNLSKEHWQIWKILEASWFPSLLFRTVDLIPQVILSQELFDIPKDVVFCPHCDTTKVGITACHNVAGRL